MLSKTEELPLKFLKVLKVCFCLLHLHFKRMRKSKRVIAEEEALPPSSKKRKSQHRFFPKREILFLRAVEAERPWERPYGALRLGWEDVARDYNSAVGDSNALTWEGARRHWERLLAIHNNNEQASLRASGTEEEYTEQEELLTDLATHYNDFKEQSEQAAESQRKKVSQ